MPRLAYVQLALVTAMILLPSPHSSDASGRATYVRPGSPDSVKDVWVVESKAGYDIYSNGLRIENRFAVSNRKRSYRVIDRARPESFAEGWRSRPAGIVFHSTESQQAPFEASQNRTLRRLGESLLAYVREKRAYNFVIDRFGRVYRIVREGDAADHAGYSVWADAKWMYVNLNPSFIGVSFEAQTDRAADEAPATAAQVVAGRMLTEMLRAQFDIAAENCVTHAQVSVNPQNMRIGWHTDWAANFPFSEMGLGDNYGRPLAALWAFGFQHDSSFVNSTGSAMWKGLAFAEEELRQGAALRGLRVHEYRQFLQNRYKTYLAALKTSGAIEEKTDE